MRHLIRITFVGFFILGACSRESLPVKSPLMPRLSQQESVFSEPQNYLNGINFCATFMNFTDREVGLWIEVPAVAGQPQRGKIKIYAYTSKPFQPELPSYVFVDGGPGQNTHGRPDLLAAGFNEIRFDQRGVGCSAPMTYQQYLSADLYSSEQTVSDMEAIRQAYGVGEWSIYGTSYGTVPATIYATRYPAHVRSVVLEGTVGPLEQLHSWDFFSYRANAALKGLSEKQRETFSDLLISPSKDGVPLLQWLQAILFDENGSQAATKTLQQIIADNGTLRRPVLDRLETRLYGAQTADPFPQHPMAVDAHFEQVIYCKELGRRNLHLTLDYDRTQGFYQRPQSSAMYATACDSLGVTAAQEHLYRFTDYHIAAPVYYFQGEQDIATLADGALLHSRKVPVKTSYFLLEKNGGHNPAVGRLIDKHNSQLQSALRSLFAKAFKAEAWSTLEIEQMNRFAGPGQQWILQQTPSKGN